MTKNSNPVYLHIYLDSLNLNKSLKYHDLIVENLIYFNEYNIPIYVITPDSEEYLQKIKKFYQTNIIYVNQMDENYSFEQNLLKEKYVFGKKYEIIYTKIKVFNENRCVYEVNRINNKTIKMAYLKAIEELFKNFKKNFKKMLTHI